MHLYLYASSLTLFLIATAVLYVCHLRSSQFQLRPQLHACYLFMLLSLLADILWSFVDGDPRFILLNHLFIILEHLCYSFTGLCWLLYTHRECSRTSKIGPAAKVLMYIPITLSVILMVASSRTGWIYTIDSHSHYARGALFPIRQIGCGYMIVASILALIHRSRTDLPLERRHFLIMASFALPPALLSTLQLLAPATCLPTTQFSIFLSLFLLYVEEQDSKITRDGLTMLRNRFEFERILKDRMARWHSDDRDQLFVLGGDLNKFKQINDTYGHQTGDRALKITADTLDRVAREYDAIVARISGDEFSVLLEAPSKSVAESFCQQAEQALEDACRQEPFRLSISLGIARYDGAMSLIELLETADRRMYAVKRRKSGKTRH